MYCPFIYAKIQCDETISKVKQPELRIVCFENNCPIKLWEPTKQVGKFTIDGHCGIIVNICENCEDLHKCKKSGENKETCRQQRIDSMFRTVQTEPSKIQVIGDSV